MTGRGRLTESGSLAGGVVFWAGWVWTGCGCCPLRGCGCATGRLKDALRPPLQGGAVDFDVGGRGLHGEFAGGEAVPERAFEVLRVYGDAAELRQAGEGEAQAGFAGGEPAQRADQGAGKDEDEPQQGGAEAAQAVFRFFRRPLRVVCGVCHLETGSQADVPADFFVLMAVGDVERGATGLNQRTPMPVPCLRVMSRKLCAVPPMS